MKHDNAHSGAVKGSTSRHVLKTDKTLDFLKRLELPVNRANYLAARFADLSIKPEHDLGDEIEASIPPFLRHPNYKQTKS